MRTFKTILVTGGAGFIGSNLIHYLFERSGFEGRIVNLDALTYAGNLESLADIQKKYGGTRYFFVKADICDRAAVEKVFADYSHRRRRPLGRGEPRRPFHPGARGLHKDQRHGHLYPPGRGPHRVEGQGRRPVPPREHRRGIRLLGRLGLLHRDYALRSALPVFGQQGLQRPPGAGLPPHLRPAHHPDQLLQQLRPLPVPREAHAPDDTRT